jgi:hypothetical protein
VPMNRGRAKRRTALAAAAIAVSLCALVGATSAGAAKAPRSFFGVVPQTPLDAPTLERMGEAHVGTLRMVFNWAGIDRTAAAGDSDWSSVDPVVLEAARNRIEVLPFLYGTPTWVAKLDGQNCGPAKCAIYAPKSKQALAAWSSFVGEAVDRYGPGGEFWVQHPEVPEDAVDAWQIWNEQNSKSFFAPKPDPKKYAKLLKAAAKSIRPRDRSADVILGGMAELAGSRKAIAGSEYLAKLYRVKGVTKNFDGVAPHPYGKSINKVSSQVDLYRDVIKQAHDSKVGLWVTEIGAGSAKGGNPLNLGNKGQAKLLKKIYAYFLKQRRKLHVEQVDWFSWQDSAQSICSWCATSGLLQSSGSAKPAYGAFTKFTGGSRG